ncbi:glutathione S-transferase D7 isoform X3 [Dendroctonus ponderosae]|uniref:glutathione S-transferase D7 isoform X3 n=1 Tax=Dendroctonus ponderosae TaxID=77166 RepID=UPI0020351184|nr:glutathione S-transferase D7 isoform X3 [Dendroctonus ponderosae]
MGSKAIDIYYYSPSPPSRAVLMLMKALGLEHNIKITNVVIGESKKPEFIKMNPLHTIPLITDNDWHLYDSHVIMQYLVDKYAKDDSLYPKDLKKRAIVNLRLFFDACYLFPKFGAYHACGSADLTKYPNIRLWYRRTKSEMSAFGYEEVNQAGSEVFAQFYKTKLSAIQ